MAQLHTSRATASIKHAQTLDTQHSEDSSRLQDRSLQPETLKADPANKLSQVRHFNMLEKLHNEMEQQRFESCFNMEYDSSVTYDMECIMILVSMPTYQVYMMDPMLFCVDTRAPISCIGDKALKGVIYSIVRKYIPMIQYL